MAESKVHLLPPLSLSELPDAYRMLCKHFRQPSMDAIVDDFTPVAIIDTVVTLWPNESILEGSVRRESYVGVCPECGQHYQCIISSQN